jgi:hypothetical protein
MVLDTLIGPSFRLLPTFHFLEVVAVPWAIYNPRDNILGNNNGSANAREGSHSRCENCFREKYDPASCFELLHKSMAIILLPLNQISDGQTGYIHGSGVNPAFSMLRQSAESSLLRYNGGCLPRLTLSLHRLQPSRK